MAPLIFCYGEDDTSKKRRSCLFWEVARLYSFTLREGLTISWFIKDLKFYNKKLGRQNQTGWRKSTRDNENVS